METYVLMTPEGKRVVINPETDVHLYEAPHNPPNTGTACTSGTDLYAHKARSGKVYYYKYHWSMWQGEQTYYNLSSDGDAREMLLHHAGNTGYGALSEKERALAEEYFPGIFDEDA